MKSQTLNTPPGEHHSTCEGRNDSWAVFEGDMRHKSHFMVFQTVSLQLFYWHRCSLWCPEGLSLMCSSNDFFHAAASVTSYSITPSGFHWSAVIRLLIMSENCFLLEGFSLIVKTRLFLLNIIWGLFGFRINKPWCVSTSVDVLELNRELAVASILSRSLWIFISESGSAFSVLCCVLVPCCYRSAFLHKRWMHSTSEKFHSGGEPILKATYLKPGTTTALVSITRLHIHHNCTKEFWFFFYAKLY